jgi:hypothetical protein
MHKPEEETLNNQSDNKFNFTLNKKNNFILCKLVKEILE